MEDQKTTFELDNRIVFVNQDINSLAVGKEEEEEETANEGNIQPPSKLQRVKLINKNTIEHDQARTLFNRSTTFSPSGGGNNNNNSSNNNNNNNNTNINHNHAHNNINKSDPTSQWFERSAEELDLAVL